MNEPTSIRKQFARNLEWPHYVTTALFFLLWATTSQSPSCSGLARSESAMTAHLSATLHAALSTPPKYLPEQRYSYETIFQDSHSLELQAEPDL
jgi:hypothetical protein